MLPVSEIFKGLWKTIDDNAPAILTAISVTGSIGTAILAGKASYQAYELIEREEHKDAHAGYQKLPFKGRAALVWTLYIPTVVSAGLTITCIIGANKIGTRRAAALATAFSLTERAFEDYKEKVVEQIGINKETKVRDAISQDRVNANPVASNQVIITGGGEVLCYESFSGRYFKSSVEAIRKAENEINRQINHDMYASLNEFNDKIGLPPNGTGEHVGWNLDTPLDIQISTVMSQDGSTPCICVGYLHLPTVTYHKLH